MIDEKLAPYRLAIIRAEYQRFKALPPNEALAHPYALCWRTIRDLLGMITQEREP